MVVGDLELVVGASWVVLGVSLGLSLLVVGIGVGLNWVVVSVLDGLRRVGEDGVGSCRAFAVVISNFDGCGEDGRSIEEKISGSGTTLGFSSSGLCCARNVGT